MDPPLRRGPHIPVPTLSIEDTCRPVGHPVDEDEALPTTTPTPPVEMTSRGPVVAGELALRPMPSMSTSDRYDGTPESHATADREDAALRERMLGADPRPTGLPSVESLLGPVTGAPRAIDTTSPEVRSLDAEILREAEEERARHHE